jgi:endoglucanase
MIEIKPFLKSLISAPGLSGNEGPIRELIAETWRPLVDELSVSPLGSLHGLRKGQGAEPRPSILLATHMDAIGLIVTGVVDGFLRVSQVGGVDPRILPGQPVLVYGKELLPGVVVQPPARLLPPALGDAPVPMDHLWVDVGLLPDQVARLVRVGALVSFGQEPIEMGENVLAGHSLDNRASVAALTVCLDELQTRRHAWDVWAAATVQEEETLGGAATSAFQLHPDLAIAIDVTFAKGPGASEYNTFPLGKGLTIGWGPNIHPWLYKLAKDTAERLEIPYEMEVMPRHSGTDAFALQVTAEGIPSLVLSVPLRYMHTPVEIISLKDVQRTGRLMAEMIACLEPDSLQKIT